MLASSSFDIAKLAPGPKPEATWCFRSPLLLADLVPQLDGTLLNEAGRDLQEVKKLLQSLRESASSVSAATPRHLLHVWHKEAAIQT